MSSTDQNEGRFSRVKEEESGSICAFVVKARCIGVCLRLQALAGRLLWACLVSLQQAKY